MRRMRDERLRFLLRDWEIPERSLEDIVGTLSVIISLLSIQGPSFTKSTEEKAETRETISLLLRLPRVPGKKSNSFTIRNSDNLRSSRFRKICYRTTENHIWKA